MARRCQKCGKGVQYGHFVSHAKNKTKRTFKPNLKRSTVVIEGKKKRMTLCVTCLKMTKKKASK